MAVTILQGDCRAVLATLPAASVQCVVTSPPYWGLRDYGVADQIGLEATPEAYLATMVGVFRAVRRVLRADGTCWVNLGDSFNDKQLVGMPWRVAFALQADGWYLRADVIWAKPNPMPESVTDRPTKSHEYVFLLTKSARYFYDAEAVAEPTAYPVPAERVPSGEYSNGSGRNDGGLHRSGGFVTGARRNLRSVWTIPSEPTPDAHFATFPRKLVAPCILAGTSARGCCAACGAPWARDVAREVTTNGAGRAHIAGGDRTIGQGWEGTPRGTTTTTTTGWRPGCDHGGAPVVPCTVLDPFGGTGTVGRVAEDLGRHSLLIELNPAYVTLAARKTAQGGLFAQGTPA